MPQRLLIFEDGTLAQTEQDITTTDYEAMIEGCLQIVEIHDDGKFYPYMSVSPVRMAPLVSDAHGPYHADEAHP